MSQILIAMLVGAVASAVMVVLCIVGGRIVNFKYDPIAAIGSLVSKESPRTLGFFIHLIMGAIFGAVYVTIWKIIGISPNVSSIAVGGATGLLHGFLVSFWMIIFVGEHHPVKRFRKQGFRIALSDIFGHFVFGAIIGYFCLH